MFRKLIFIMILGVTAQASELTHEFKNPSFSGNGYSTHVLSIEQLRYSRKNDVRDEQRRLEAQAKRDEESTTINKFIKNVESRIYANLSKQLVDNMFSNENAVTFGSFTLEGSVVSYEVMTDASGEDYIQMRITDAEGTETVIEIPIGTGNFGSPDDNLDAI